MYSHKGYHGAFEISPEQMMSIYCGSGKNGQLNFNQKSQGVKALTCSSVPAPRPGLSAEGAWLKKYLTRTMISAYLGIIKVVIINMNMFVIRIIGSNDNGACSTRYPSRASRDAIQKKMVGSYGHCP